MLSSSNELVQAKFVQDSESKCIRLFVIFQRTCVNEFASMNLIPQQTYVNELVVPKFVDLNELIDLNELVDFLLNELVY